MRILFIRTFLAAICLPISWASAQITALPASAGAGQTGARSGGTIRGLVIDASGQPVARAKIEIKMVPEPVHSQRKLWDADASGHFAISSVAWGRYEIYAIASKPGGTLSTYGTWFFARDEPGQTVAVSPEARDMEVTVQIGLEPAHLAPIAVVDAVTGRPITGTDPVSGQQVSLVTIALTRLDRNNTPVRTVSVNAPVLSTSAAQVNVLLPAQVPVIAKIEAPGYSVWYYPGTDDRSLARPFILKPGEEFSLGNVLLRPLKKP